MAIPKKQVIKIGKRFFRRPSLYIIITLIIGLLVQWQSHHHHARMFTSTVVRVVDGDTIVLNGLKIRLQGIDAPESKQSCTNKVTGEIWPCGIVATQKLVEIIAGKEVACTDEGKDKYQRQLAYCYVGEMNINAEMVKQGYAVAYIQYDIIFLLDELYARWYSYGIWSSNFIRPNEWRQQNKRRTNI